MGEGLMLKQVKTLWQNIRQLSGDDAYERYLKHYAEFHKADALHTNALQEDLEPPLSREAFFKQWQDGKWKGIKRCC
jgi:uncharacterized short protein YbdD (DUF466 family)